MGAAAGEEAAAVGAAPEPLLLPPAACFFLPMLSRLSTSFQRIASARSEGMLRRNSVASALPDVSIFFWSTRTISSSEAPCS